MASRLNPYISFADEARQAMEFYQSVFGGELQLHTFGEFGSPDAPEANLIMHGMLETAGGFTLMGADTPPGMPRSEGSSITISLSGDATSADELSGYFAALSDGGTVSVPLETQMWGSVFGMCTDRFGIGWMVNIG